MAQFDKVSSPSLIDSIKQQLLTKILSGELKAGTRLPAERDLAAQLGVSRSSLHQVILALESEGFLSIVPRRGTLVNDYRKHPTPQSLTALMSYGSIELDYRLFYDMMEARIWLESECARLACENIYDSTLLEMQQLTDDMKKPGADLVELIYGFHYRLTQASGNIVYSMIFRGFEPVIRSLTQQHYNVQVIDLDESIRLRCLLLESIRSKQPEAAADYVTRVIRQAIQVLELKYSE